MKHHTLQEFIEHLHSSHSGLSQAEAERRLHEFGPNVIEEERKIPALSKFFAGLTHFFAIILWFGAGLAFFAEWKSPGNGMNYLGWAITGVIVVNGLFSFWQEYKAEQAIAELKKLIPHTVKVLRDGVLKEVPSSTLVLGDLILLEEGDDVPADCRIVESFSLRANYATLTGEALPLPRTAIDCPEENPLHHRNLLLAGTSICTGQGKAMVYATGMHTEFGKIAHLTQTTKRSLSPLQNEIVRLSRVIATIAVSVGLIFFIVGRSIGISFWANTLFALGIIVALVPEGLLPEVTLALATCSLRMANRNALVRHLPSVETLGCATVICTDKTGTLTENKMWVNELFFCGRSFKSLDLANLPESLCGVFSDMRRVAFYCENAKETEREGKKVLLGDPMEIALLNFARAPYGMLQSSQTENPDTSSSILKNAEEDADGQIDAETADPGFVTYCKRIDEIPFDTERKRLSVVMQNSDGKNMLFSKGALELMLPLCRYVRNENGETIIDDETRTMFLRTQERMTRRGLRVIALCQRALPEPYEKEYAESRLSIIGLVGLQDPPRKEVPEAIKRCKQAGIRVIMITGDHPNTAESIAREIGLAESNSCSVISGTELRKMSDMQLQLVLSRREVIFARAEAEQKMRIVQALKRSGEVVAVTGDGVNDAPALKAADIGIAMGLSGTDVAREAAVMVLADDNFASIVDAIEEGRAVFANIRKFLCYVLASNIAELIPCLLFVLFKIPLPLTVMQILSIDLGTDVLPALALGAEKPDHFLMCVPPRRKQSGLFDLPLMLKAYFYLGAMVSSVSMIAFFFVLQINGWHYGEMPSSESLTYKQATTACLMGLMSMQIANSSICRSERKSIFSLGLFSNPMLNSGVAAEITLMALITYSQPGQTIFGTAALPGCFWALMLPFMIAMLLIEELRKLYIRQKPSSWLKNSGKNPSTA